MECEREIVEGVCDVFYQQDQSREASLNEQKQAIRQKKTVAEKFPLSSFHETVQAVCGIVCFFYSYK